jgi:catechol 2,3-dioxygenase-like lactoylglutathione lyase family enzyme
VFDRVHHVQLAMPRGAEAAARAFFVDVLGMTEIDKPVVLAARGGVWFSAGGVELHLGVEDDFRPARKAHPGIVVDDLDALVEQLLDEHHPTPPHIPGDPRPITYTINTTQPTSTVILTQLPEV